MKKENEKTTKPLFVSLGLVADWLALSPDKVSQGSQSIS
jgi:hypothetical protein